MIRWFIAFLFFTAPAFAHSWYDKDCCDTQDCHPLPKGAVQFDLTTLTYHVKYVTDDNFIVDQVFKVGDDRIRYGQDNQYHGCEKYKYDDRYFISGRELRCFYIPGGDM